MLAREGFGIIITASLIGLGLIVLGLWLGGYWAFMIIFGLLVAAFTLWFFRDPKRTPPHEAGAGDLILAPADGKIVEIVEEEEPLFIRGQARRLSIFLSPLNVHVNRIPVDGTIEYAEYVPGEYLVAWHPKASSKNERSELGLRHEDGTKVVFKQIAGAVARRIVYHIRVGDIVKAGDRFGIVKFGSRMDVIVPPHVTFTAKVGDRVMAGVTVIGRLPATTGADAEQN
ncbi:phosphatidylserine decarboxylase family protein [soil metagenome]